MIFLLIGILTNLKRCHLPTKNLKKLIFINKNKPNDLRIKHKFSSNLIESLQRDIDFKKKLENFESDCEKMKLLKYENGINILLVIF